jgi:hypothetical protein
MLFKDGETGLMKSERKGMRPSASESLRCMTFSFSGDSVVYIALIIELGIELGIAAVQE